MSSAPRPPEIGQKAGQQFPVLKSIQTFLKQMAEGGARPSPTVLKELLQNADDAGATELAIILDERDGSRVSALCPECATLCSPALLVRNNRPFRLASEVGAEHDDFTNILNVAGGHKWAQATAAGRFGIGFNSVYFLTDTPLIFSRREIHVFDLLKEMFGENGWRFPLDAFPRNAGSQVGPMKEVLDWCLPIAVLESNSLGNIAGEPQGDYKQTVFRLPLRRTPEGTPALYDDRFPDVQGRQAVLTAMAEEAAHSIHFLKNICKISFSVLRERQAEPFVVVEASPCPEKFKLFVESVNELATQQQAAEPLGCDFQRIITRRDFGWKGGQETSTTWRFHVQHVARFDDVSLVQLRERLRRNEEKAVPWAAIAVPLDIASCRLAGGEAAKWRVFLPLLEDGPCGCIVHGAFFVGPSRQRLEYRLDQSDAQMRKTEWNQRLVEKALSPLLRDISLELPELAQTLMEENPKEYLNLFPVIASLKTTPNNLTEFVRRCFSSDAWALRLRDIWNDPFDLLIGDGGIETTVELVPEWLFAYRGKFKDLASDRRRFVRFVLGDALAARIGQGGSISVQRAVSPDVALKVLRDAEPPKAADLERLLKIVVASEDFHGALEEAWAFQDQGTDKLSRFAASKLYVLEEPGGDPIIEHLRRLRLSFDNTNWVRPDIGLPKLLADLRPALTNILKPTAEAGLELLRRLPATNSHDQLEHDYEVKPVIEFLLTQQPGRIPGDLRLGFLVRTAHAQVDRRALEVLLLKPAKPTEEDKAFEEVWFRRVFSHADPNFEALIQKLLAVHPACLEMLHASDCRVTTARSHEALGILHAARLKQPEFCGTLEKEMANAAIQHPKLAERVAAWLLDAADTSWDSMEQPQRYTVLALPIHRCSDGKFVALVTAHGDDMATVARDFWLQSQDDIEDAPIKLPSCRLLQTPNAVVKRFYRLRLGIKAHNRVEVLKETLRQIGGPTTDSERMLRYLVRYYDATLAGLDGSGDSTDKLDAEELRALMVSARIVPCLDGLWYAAEDSAEAWQVADRLNEQKWPKNRLGPLMVELFSGKNIASVDVHFRELLQRLKRLESWDARKIVELAITSESKNLGLRDRVKLFWDNRRDLPEVGVVRSNAAGLLQVPTQIGQAALAETEFFQGMADLPQRVLSLLAPKAIALADLASAVELKVTELPQVLRAFQVTELTAQDFQNRFLDGFAGFWAGLDHSERFQTLRYIDTRALAGQLAEDAKSLDTVLVATRKPTWKSPLTVVSPHWAATVPPLVPPEVLPALEKLPDAVLRVWNEWCAVRTFGDVFSAVIAQALNGTSEKRGTAKAIYAWLEKAVGASPNAEEVKVLNAQPWVLAEQGGTLGFKKPADVLVHAGEKVLGARFWVRATAMPDCCGVGSPVLGFQMMPEAVPAELEKICDCLVDRARSDEAAALKVYELIAQLLENFEALRPHWMSLAARSSVYRTFRDKERQVTSLQLFLGDNDFKEDFSANLLCLKANSKPPKGLTEAYRRLGVSEREILSQVLVALTQITSADPDVAISYGRLLGALQRLADKEPTQLQPASIGAIRVLTCAGTYERLDSLHWDDLLGRKGRVIAAHAALLVDTQNQPTRRFADWLRQRCPEALSNLRTCARIEAADNPALVPLPPAASHLLNPWRRWLKDLATPESALCAAFSGLGVNFPEKPLEPIAVDQIRLRCLLPNGQIIEQSTKWEGPTALADAGGRLLVRAKTLQPPEDRRENGWLGELDRAMASEVARLLRSGASTGDSSLSEEILKTLERPATVLRRLHDNYREHFIHQYQDQVADPDFAELFDQFQRTDPHRPRAEELKSQMFALLTAKFVQARRDQIRGYGYDEFSVFAELLQNAEDAYVQREQLGMETRSPREITYRYVPREGTTPILEIEHRGRPFNYSQHGIRHFPNFSKDVEGVLRSAGSFKPHVSVGNAEQSDGQTIGRFGLGFKCVYLLTDRPEIHSEDWHFAIEAGCLPKELPGPDDLPAEVTRIRLPLRSDAAEPKDMSRFVGLVPFLRMITRLEVQPSAGEGTIIVVKPDEPKSVNGTLLEYVEISAPKAVRGGAVRLIRCRSNSHAGHLALLLAQDGTPARWDEVFPHDLYAALPLQARLGCGLAASHRFEVQSGRTHLVDPKANERRIVEIGALLEGLLHALPACTSATTPLSEILKRFWSIWQWERGDVECERLRKTLATELVQLAERMPIVPTLAPEKPISLGQGPCFYFYEVPDDFRRGLVEARITVDFAGHQATPLEQTNIVVEGFATAYRRSCEYAGKQSAQNLLGIGWAEISAAFRTRPWFATKPSLLDLLASMLKEEQFLATGKWVSQCQVLGMHGSGAKIHDFPSHLLTPDFPGHKHLPCRFLKFISGDYTNAGLKLLGFAGLQAKPSEGDLGQWVSAPDLTETEGIGILKYLSDADRFRDYWELSALFRSPWFPAMGKRLTSKEASNLRLIPAEIIESEVFRAWLGIIEETQEEPQKPARPIYDARLVLGRLYEWWQAHGHAWVGGYIERVYPEGRAPSVRTEFFEKDLSDRREWIKLLLLGSMQTIGRSNPEQHRNFLSRCEEKGWLDVFADGEHDARRWMDLLEGYLDDPAGTQDYYQWMKQFVVIFQLSRWLPDYVESFLNVNRIKKAFGFDDIISPRTSSLYSGGGPDAPALTRALGIGACFVIRELSRLGILKQKLANRYCYVPRSRICGVLETIGSPCFRLLATGDRSTAIHRFLVENLDDERATFNCCFDLPLMALSEEEDVQIEVLGNPLPFEDAPSTSRPDEGWRTLADGRRINLNW
jgi:hypothetical protein